MQSLEQRVETLEEIVLALFQAMLGKRKLTNLQMMDLKRRVELSLEISKAPNVLNMDDDEPPKGKIIPRSIAKALRNKKRENDEVDL